MPQLTRQNSRGQAVGPESPERSVSRARPVWSDWNSPRNPGGARRAVGNSAVQETAAALDRPVYSVIPTFAVIDDFVERRPPQDLPQVEARPDFARQIEEQFKPLVLSS